MSQGFSYSYSRQGRTYPFIRFLFFLNQAITQPTSSRCRFLLPTRTCQPFPAAPSKKVCLLSAVPVCNHKLPGICAKLTQHQCASHIGDWVQLGSSTCAVHHKVVSCCKCEHLDLNLCCKSKHVPDTCTCFELFTLVVHAVRMCTSCIHFLCAHVSNA
jgi:hypothetical protein